MDAIAQYGTSDEEGHSEGQYYEGQQGILNHRIRNFPHVQGNYATHVYIQVDIPQRCCGALRALQDALQAACPVPCNPLVVLSPDYEDGRCIFEKSLAPGLQSKPASYHISLSRTVAIRSQQIKSLLAQLRHQLRRLKRFPVKIASQNMMVLENDERTCTFVALSVAVNGSEHPTNPLERAMDAVSNAFQYHGLPRYYEDPRPHVSIGWMLGAQSQQVTGDVLSAHPGVSDAHQHLHNLNWAFEPAEVICKIGQKCHVVWHAAE